MNHNILHLLLIFIFIVDSLQAQQTVAATGGEASGSGGTVSYSVGQIVYTTAVGGQINISQGVQQPYEFSTLGIDDYAGITLSMKVFPNPVADYVVLKIEMPRPVALKYLLSDFSGKPLRMDVIVDDETEIFMKKHPSATYFLIVSDEKSVLKTFKIIKN